MTEGPATESQSIDLPWKSIDWSLYDIDFHHEVVKFIRSSFIFKIVFQMFSTILFIISEHLHLHLQVGLDHDLNYSLNLLKDVYFLTFSGRLMLPYFSVLQFCN